jgi:hypothetical protein
VKPDGVLLLFFILLLHDWKYFVKTLVHEKKLGEVKGKHVYFQLIIKLFKNSSNYNLDAIWISIKERIAL